MLRAIICAIIFLVAPIIHISAQKMNVESFRPDDKDITANTAPTLRMDKNGEKCALIKIQTTERQFMFDVGSLGIEYLEEQNASHPAEIWLYVPHGVKTITIQHPVLGVINDYNLGRSVKKGKTYVMKLTSDQVSTLVVDYDNEQFLNVAITPPYATFIINGMKQQLSPKGTCEIPLSFGTHTYRVTAKDYHPAESQVIINDKNNKQFLKIDLKQAFGYLTVEARPEFNGADVFIDGERAGALPMKDFPVASGNHKVRIHKQLYADYTRDIAVTDSAWVSITPAFSANYAEAELTVPADKGAQIFVDGALLGTGSWKGRLEAGHHKAEVRKDSHRTAVAEFDVEKDRKLTLTLERPQPIYGTLKVVTSPPGATVIVDGREAGLTPLTDDRLLIGQHSVEVVKKGHRNEKSSVIISENRTSDLNFSLTDICTASIIPSPSYANIFINDEWMNRNTSGALKLDKVAGEYKIKVTARGYTPWSRTMRLDGNTKDINVTLHRDYVRRNELYINAGFNLLCCQGVSFGVGGYYHKFNLEGNFLLGLSKSETIYWTDQNADTYPYGVSYKPMGGMVKLGYGFRIGNRIRLTPQVGCQIVSLSEKEEEYSGYGYSPVSSPMAVSATFGARLSVSLSPSLALSASPQYAVGVIKSDGYKALADLSSKIKGYSDGFGCNICLNLYF